MLKLALETLVSSQTKPKMIMMTNNSTLRVPSKLLSLIPHFRDMLCIKQEKVLTPIAMATIFPAVAVAPAA